MARSSRGCGFQLRRLSCLLQTSCVPVTIPWTLKGGIWINIGPLMFENDGEDRGLQAAGFRQSSGYLPGIFRGSRRASRKLRALAGHVRSAGVDSLG